VATNALPDPRLGQERRLITAGPRTGRQSRRHEGDHRLIPQRVVDLDTREIKARAATLLITS